MQIVMVLFQTCFMLEYCFTRIQLPYIKNKNKEKEYGIFSVQASLTVFLAAERNIERPCMS